jgi:hypothetical protein
MKSVRWSFIAVVFLCLTATAGQSRLRAQEPATKPADSDGLPGLISKVSLNPALIGRLSEMRFSPNGAHLLLQGDSTAYVIGTNPVAMQLNLAAKQLLPLRFSPDSQELVAATPNLQVVRFSIDSRTRTGQKTLGGGGRCYAAALSNDGKLYACLDDKSELRVFRTRTGKQIFKKEIGEQEGPSFPVPAPYHDQMGLARSQPFGYYLTTDYTPPEVITAAMLEFSVDGHYLIARSKFFQQHAELIDLQAKKAIGMPKALRPAADAGTVTFVSADRVVATTLGKGGGSELLSFPAGDAIGKLDFAGFLNATDNPRFIVDVPPDMSGVKLIDLQTNKAVAQLPMGAIDVNGQLIASHSEGGVLTLTRIGESKPLVRAQMPVSPLPVLRTAAVSPGLETIALGIDGSAGVYSVTTGKRIAPILGLSGAWFPNDQTCYFRTAGMGPGTSALKSMDLKSGTPSNLATLQETPYQNETISSGPVLLKHWVKPLLPGQMPQMVGRSFPYEIHALDSANGKLLWKRAFEVDRYTQTPQIKTTPVAYTDPQGDRIVLGWGARTPGGKHAADLSPVAKKVMKEAKVTEHDSVFEVLDARSGKTISVAFVKTDSGPDAFDSVFSEGDWLVLAKDGRRVSVISLSTGAQVAQENGYLPAISSAAGLLSFADNSGHLTVVDLKTPGRQRQYTFPKNVAYSHFSADGKRLLVMTEDQTVYVLRAGA